MDSVSSRLVLQSITPLQQQGVESEVDMFPNLEPKGEISGTKEREALSPPSGRQCCLASKEGDTQNSQGEHRS